MLKIGDGNIDAGHLCSV
uniref:Uncharacterized protein n=1 Tax=Rhizophora mucronata TaxID=61149 RepID=A0A2P2Q128_RHIMU